MNVLNFDGSRHWGWIVDKLDLKQFPDTCGFVCEEDGKLVGCVMFDSFLNKSCQIHVAATTSRVFTSGIVELSMTFLFEQQGINFLYSFIRSDNKKALLMNENLGFKLQMVMPDSYKKGVDYIVMQLHKDECPLYQAFRENRQRAA